MAESKSVVIRLTNEQREAIKRATGKDITELKVDALEGRITPGEIADFRKAPLEARKAPMEQRKAPFELKTDDVPEQRKAPSALDTDSNEPRKAPLVNE